MGKAKHFKQIRKLASKLPVLSTRVPIGEIVYGYQLQQDGIKEVEGKAVDAKKEYRRVRGELRAVNHYRQMKRYFYQYGVQGVMEYARAVQRYVSAQKVKQQQAA